MKTGFYFNILKIWSKTNCVPIRFQSVRFVNYNISVQNIMLLVPTSFYKIIFFLKKTYASFNTDAAEFCNLCNFPKNILCIFLPYKLSSLSRTTTFHFWVVQSNDLSNFLPTRNDILHYSAGYFFFQNTHDLRICMYKNKLKYKNFVIIDYFTMILTINRQKTFNTS